MKAGKNGGQMLQYLSAVLFYTNGSTIFGAHILTKQQFSLSLAHQQATPIHNLLL